MLYNVLYNVFMMNEINFNSIKKIKKNPFIVMQNAKTSMTWHNNTTWLFSIKNTK